MSRKSGRGSGASRRARVDERFAHAVRLHQNGRLADAEAEYRGVLERDPEHLAARHYLALVRHARGARAEALSLLADAARAPHADAALLNNLGNLLRESGRAADALDAYRDAVARDPTHVNARFNLAVSLLDSGDAAAAVGQLEPLVAQAPEDRGVLETLARAHLRSGDASAAADCLQRVVATAPEELAPRLRLVDALSRAQRIEEALEAALEARRVGPESPATARALGAAYLALERYEQSVELLEPVVAQTPRDRDARLSLVRALVALERGEQALALVDAGLALQPEDPELHLARANTLVRAGRLREAVSAFERALELRPNWPEALNNLAVTYIDLGQVERADAILDHAIAVAPELPELWFHLARGRGRAVDDAELAKLEARSRDGNLKLDSRIALHFALGQLYDRRRRFDEAFEHYRTGNDLKRRTARFLPDEFERWVAGFYQAFTPELIARLSDAGNPSERPVFIVGMPRSGTTLVEQILASHPQVFGGDELSTLSRLAETIADRTGSPDAYPLSARALQPGALGAIAHAYLTRLQALDAHAARVTDKMPTNFFHIGLIACLFPRARIVHCTRDPMDTCFSNYIQLFGDAHFYSYSLSDIAVYFRHYRALMAHWQRLLPGRIHELRYEALLEDQQRESRRLIAFLGLAWDDACLEFHRTRRPVRTASHWQVRQPIYRGARQRWKNYAAHLEPLRRALGDALQPA